ncbi:MAG: [ribosomal protein S18]-alanine N-acetyltransferase [Petroclostridium sp.]|uniref:ribosomal protein S18-alanine N-acetyltransferase n=1 Tax=Petroclostridium xylanilyticum TaxID=1792311 RepID=UPI000B9864C9|nr:ribosomal protein S18-alanine N-acetyltransferase [Petroclostridium xylanilyticum]MBZ4646185.1 ribosomal-protein-alanine acetyltransferase [Clostridia bacterium]MDK2810386.1 [ribosomal protein S18]-alanine N-acetyltransferase [Petroclostridium sp.]
MQITIAPMELWDIDGVMEIEYASFAIPWSREAFEEELINNKHAVYIVAKQGNKVIGYGGMWKVLEEGHITNIAVHPDFRRMRVGYAIVEALTQIAKNKGIGSMTLEVRENNIAAQGLYRKFGFEVVGRRKKYYADNNEDALIMTMVMIN